jgi:hypothetical protein
MVVARERQGPALKLTVKLMMVLLLEFVALDPPPHLCSPFHIFPQTGIGAYFPIDNLYLSANIRCFCCFFDFW